MVEHFELKDYPYEERRMDFFKQKRLEAERRVNHWSKRAVNGAYNSIQHEKVCDAADELSFYNDAIDALKTQQWISVNDSLPELEQKVLIYAVGRESGFEDSVHIEVSMRYVFHILPWDTGVEEWQAPWDYFNRNYEVTHWMPLPQAPKEDVE